jgi:mono/diheme cytochrome c family protein
MPTNHRALVQTALIALPTLCLLAFWSSQGAAEPSSAKSHAAQGERIAERICTTCHRVPEAGGAPVGPPFGTLAERGDWSAQQLQQILNTAQHEEAVPASRLQLEAVARYLERLDS